MDDISMRLYLIIVILAFVCIVEAAYLMKLRKSQENKLTASNHSHSQEEEHEDEESNEYEEEIKNMVELGMKEGAIEEDEQALINNVFEFGDKEAQDVMRFRKKIVAINADLTLDQALEFMLEQPYSRYPLYDGDIDNIIGIIYLKDVTQAYYQQKKVSLRELARPAVYVHETMEISDLFKKMQRKKMHMAIVIDEYGQTEGIVAMEDMTEVLMGNIYDEYDVVEREIIKLNDGEGYLVQGMTRLDVLEELLGIEFKEQDVETINGFLLAQLHRLPKDNDVVEIDYEGYSFKSVDIHDKMIRQIKVSKLSNIEKGE